ncbi:MAG TPA: hypothetical protein VHW23_17740 [Kofleriaceae bacterium]|nr:hypothetical protein [Kofleriaceae bacterium]
MRLGFSVGIGVLAAIAGPGRPAHAGTVVGKLELPAPPERGPVIAKGFVDRVENPLADIKKPSVAPYLVVVLESEGGGDAAAAQVNWDLVGESFTRPVVAVPVGAEVVIKNQTKVARNLAVAEDPKLIVGPLNPTGTKSFRATQPATYTVSDKDAPYLHGKLVVVATTHVAAVDDSGRFEIADVPDGSYKLKVFYYDPVGEARGKPSGWLFTTDVTVAPKGRTNRTEVNAKLPSLTAAGKK